MDLLLADMARDNLPDLVLLSPEELAAARALGLLPTSGSSDQRALQPAGLVVPLVLARTDIALDWSEPLTWGALAEPPAASGPSAEPHGELAWLDPGPFDSTVSWLRLRAGLPASHPAHAAPGAWRALLQAMATVHQAPRSTRFWEKRWFEGTRTFRRGRTAVAIGDTEMLRQTGPAVPQAQSYLVPPLSTDAIRYPVRVPAWWVVLHPSSSSSAEALLDALTAPETVARVARFRGWAPVEPAVWSHPAMRRLVADVPAWGTVRDVLAAGAHGNAFVPTTDAGTDAAFATAIGLWLAGVRDAEAAWALAMANATPAEATASAPKTLGERCAADLSSAESPPGGLVTVTQGEWVLLRVDARLRSGLLKHAPESSGAGKYHVSLEAELEQYEVDAAFLRLRPETDALEPMQPNRLMGEQDAFVEFQVPEATEPGTYKTFLTRTPGDRSPNHGTELPRIRVTAADLGAVRVPAVCGIGEAAPASAIPAIRALLCRHGFTAFPLPWSDLDSRCVPGDPLIVRRWHDPTEAESDAAKARELGVLDALVAYSYDEPTLLHFPHIIAEGPPYDRLGIRVLVTHPPTPYLKDHADIWGVHTSLRPTDTPSTARAWRETIRAIAAARTRGEEVWWYTAGDVAPLPNLQVDADLTQLRAAFFRLPGLGFSGVLQADAAAWPADPSATGPARTALGVGEGLLCYPGPTPGAAVASARLKALRDGVHTMRLLQRLRAALHTHVDTLPDAHLWAAYPAERLAAYGRSAVDARLLAVEPALHPFVGLTTSDAQFHEAGGSLREELHAFLQGPAILLRADVPDWSVTERDTVTLTGCVEPGAALRIGGVPHAAGPHGLFTWTGTLSDGANVIAVEAHLGSRQSTLRWHVWRMRAPLSVSDACVTMPFLGAEEP